MTRKNAFYAQSGGVTAVINASACGVIQTARHHSDQIGKVVKGAAKTCKVSAPDVAKLNVAALFPQMPQPK